MTNIPIVSRLTPLKQVFTWGWQLITRRHWHRRRPNLHQLAQNPGLVPRFVRESPVAMPYLHLLEPLDWDRFPQCDLETTEGYRRYHTPHRSSLPGQVGSAVCLYASSAPAPDEAPPPWSVFGPSPRSLSQAPLELRQRCCSATAHYFVCTLCTTQDALSQCPHDRTALCAC